MYNIDYTRVTLYYLDYILIQSLSRRPLIEIEFNFLDERQRFKTLFNRLKSLTQKGAKLIMRAPVPPSPCRAKMQDYMLM